MKGAEKLSINQELLLIKIDSKRRELSNLLVDKGFQTADPEVIKLSQEIDKMVTEYYRLRE